MKKTIWFKNEMEGSNYLIVNVEGFDKEKFLSTNGGEETIDYIENKCNGKIFEFNSLEELNEIMKENKVITFQYEKCRW